MDQVGSMLLPLFFVVTGLPLNIGAMRGDAFLLLVVVVVIACAGKLGPGYGISRARRLSPRDSATILVFMALITTLVTSPLLSIIKPIRALQPTTGQYVM
jgi:Kef-type K+ transport system membrane component KefB